MLLLWWTTLALASPHVPWDARWRMDSQVHAPHPVRFEAPSGAGAEVSRWGLAAVLACEVTERRKRRAEVRCRFEDLALDLESAHEEPVPDGLAEEVGAVLRGGVVRMTVDDTGRVRHLSLADVPDHNPRLLGLSRTLRMAVDRLVVGLDWHRPTPREEAAGQWVGWDVTLATLPALSDARPMGTVTVEHRQIGSDRLDLVGTGSAVWLGTGTALALTVRATTRFDGAGGLEARTFEVSGARRGGEGEPYLHAGQIRRLGPDERPDLRE